jgi:hypothetical protein
MLAATQSMQCHVTGWQWVMSGKERGRKQPFLNLRYCAWMPEENRYSISGCAVPRPTLEPNTSQIQFGKATAWANLLGDSLHKTEGKCTKLFINYRNINLPNIIQPRFYYLWILEHSFADHQDLKAYRGNKCKPPCILDHTNVEVDWSTSGSDLFISN